jgi:hypothetical protein
MMTLVLFPSSVHEPAAAADAEDREDRIARLTDAAYQVALRHGLTGSFVEIQLGIWSAIRQVIEEERSFHEDSQQGRRAQRHMPAQVADIG